MYYQQYNVYKPGWYTGNAFPQTGTGIIQHPSSPSNVQTSPYVSCMHEEQSAWGQIFQTPSPPHHHHHHHHNHHNGTAGPPTILQTAGPPPPPSSAHPPPPTQSSELWDDAAVLAAAAVAAQNNSPTGQHQQQHQQSSQQHQQSSQQQHTSPNCNPQIVDHHVRAQPPRSPFEWMKKPSYHSQPNPGKTRTKDKYRVVYTDHQRLELEKEFHYSRYITIRRKAELATLLGLSERQVKIWFQNRRAKERKQVKKREELIHKEKMQQLAML